MAIKAKVNKNLSWRELKALNDLYVGGKTLVKVHDLPYIKYLVEKRLVTFKLKSNMVLYAADDFAVFYELHYLENFNMYKGFMERADLPSDAKRNYTEEDIKTLMFILKNREQIVANLTTLGKFTNEFFHKKGSKYIKNKKSLKDAVCTVLGIDDFPEFEAKEHQWRFVVDCSHPRAVVLCENLDFLKMPWKVERSELKLWYVGGNNIGIIDKIDHLEFKYPFFYSCDWDCAGLKIYSRIKRKLEVYHKDIVLLIPDNLENRLPVDSPHHFSKWDCSKPLSGLNTADFNEEETRLILELIKYDQWLEEESNDLEVMMGGLL
jgi:hypothetical protein